MNDVARLEHAFRSGTLLRPDGGPNLVDLSLALARLAGVGGIELSPGARRIAEALPPSDHFVFVLVDGLGMNLVERRPATSFLRSHVAMELRSVFPSSTAPALTTLATGAWPGRHGVPAWWTHLPHARATATILKFTERFAGTPLAADPREVFPEPSLAERMTVHACSFQPRAITDSVYTRYARGGREGYGYGALPDAVDAVVRRVAEAAHPTYTYLYYPILDAVEHARGPFSPEAEAHLAIVERELSRLADGLAGRARLVASADHGQLEVPDGTKAFLSPGDPLLDGLLHPPAGEPRVVMFHRGTADGFPARFRDRFGERFALLSSDEAAGLELFGPFLAAETRARIGDFVAIALEPAILLYGPPVHHREEAAMRGYHGGLMPDEMRVPLVVV